jgi:hypothetical protein
LEISFDSMNLGKSSSIVRYLLPPATSKWPKWS